jgi:hypothetical protein
MPEETKEPRKQATFNRDAHVTVTFSPKALNRRNPEDEPSDAEFHIVYMDMQDGNGPSDIGEAYLKSGDFDIEMYVSRSAQPYAYQLLHAAEGRFKTRNISIEYVD